MKLSNSTFSASNIYTEDNFPWTHRLIHFDIDFSWFAETTDLFSPYFVVQLISFMIFLACNAFQLDMVINLNLFYNLLNLIYFILTIWILFSTTSSVHISTWVSLCYCQQLRSPFLVCSFSAFLQNRERKVFWKWATVCTIQIGKSYQFDIRNISFQLYKTLKNRYIIPAMASHTWIWRHLQKWVDILSHNIQKDLQTSSLEMEHFIAVDFLTLSLFPFSASRQLSPIIWRSRP